MCVLVLLVSAWIAIYEALVVLTGWQSGEVELFHTRLSMMRFSYLRSVRLADQPEIYWAHMGIHTFVAASGLVLAAAVLWIYLNRSRL